MEPIVQVVETNQSMDSDGIELDL